MAAKQKVMLMGVVGDAALSIYDGLIESGNFHVEVMESPECVLPRKLQRQGTKIHLVDLEDSSKLVSLLTGFDTLICAIGPNDLFLQKAVLQPAKLAGIKRFVPCAFDTVTPPRVVIITRDETKIYGDGTAPNNLTNVPDIGKFVARIIQDDRTLNQYVYTYGDVLSQKEAIQIGEEIIGEKVETKHVQQDLIEVSLQRSKEVFNKDPENLNLRLGLYTAQRIYSQYIRQDNTPANAESLGYLNARELYPDFKPRNFREVFAETRAKGAQKA
ncbi:hypothetical protein PENSTE_c008G01359 [Penicillium steckii]|uniref:NmrA-like domain-containing protein n=1 Tax=Penicillium steckii TaxID=303698 RepID=A0A1V6TC51_9EURO|nr:hypothetical protein PENSTE_c008G01359 [Penicillium steckii]